MSNILPLSFELWLADLGRQGLGELDAHQRSQLAEKLSELGAEKPADLAELDNWRRDELMSSYPAFAAKIAEAKLGMDGGIYDRVHDLPEAFVSWLNAGGMGGLDVRMRVKLAEILFTLGAEEPGDLNELEEEDIVDLRALIETMGNNNKTKFNALF